MLRLDPGVPLPLETKRQACLRRVPRDVRSDQPLLGRQGTAIPKKNGRYRCEGMNDDDQRKSQKSKVEPSQRRSSASRAELSRKVKTATS